MDLPFQHRFYKLRTRGNISPVEREGEGGGARFLRPSGEEEKIGPRQFPFRKGEAGKRVRGGHTRGKGEGERRREWKIRKWNEPLLLPFLFHSPPPSTPLPHLDGYFPLLKEKRERERGEEGCVECNFTGTTTSARMPVVFHVAVCSPCCFHSIKRQSLLLAREGNNVTIS